MMRGLLRTLTLILPGLVVCDCRGQEIEVFIRLIEEARTPAREAGVLKEVSAKEGQLVREGQLLARVEDSQARYQHRRAELEVQIAREEAEDDVIVRAAEKAAAVAHNDWQRAEKAVDLNPNAISASEVEHLRLTAEKAALDVERSQRDFRIAQVNRDVKKNELEFAAEQLERHQVIAPIDGMVVEVNRRRGEWVEPGDNVARIVRIDRLRAEGFSDAREVRADWVGRAVTILIDKDGPNPESFAGKIIFVSPEIDPVNGQIALWAEVDNPQLRLRPGLRGTMTIDREKAP
ncbi:MAG: efflux RND transporter periplasmic adaptor subunit [Planctomycetes bacterium]|nr:efflux RND transporter periplasmic adaptor subunit [Planctomycetota bacterium]